MPSTKKTLHFISSALATSISIGLLGYGMSEEWAKTTMECASGGSGNFNGTAEITFALFNGFLDRSFCPLFGGVNEFEGNFQRLSKGQFTQIAGYVLAYTPLGSRHVDRPGFISPGFEISAL